MKRIVLSFVFMFVLTTTAFAQTETPRVEAGKTFGVAADHDGINTDNYDVIVDGVIVATLPFSSLTGGTITFTGLTAPSRGSHNVVIRARNVDNLFTDSDPLEFDTTKGKPNKPGKPRIIAGLIAILRAPLELLGLLPRSGSGGFSNVRIIVES